MQVTPQFGARHIIPLGREVVSQLKHTEHEGDRYTGIAQGQNLLVLTDDLADLGSLTDEQTALLKQAVSGERPMLSQDHSAFRAAMDLVDRLTGKAEIVNRRRPYCPERPFLPRSVLPREYVDIKEREYEQQLREYDRQLKQYERQQREDLDAVAPLVEKARAKVIEYFTSVTGWL